MVTFLQKHATLRLSVLEVLEEISKYCDLYLMETVLDDESEVKIIFVFIFHPSLPEYNYRLAGIMHYSVL